MFYSDFSRRPINQEDPCGKNPNELDDFEKIKRQINNLNRVERSVSWSEIEILSRKILTHHAKDLRCACYYAIALIHSGGLKGFIDGLAVISDICLIYWEGAFPDKKKNANRISLFEWYIEYAAPLQEKIKIKSTDLPLLEIGSYLCVKIEEELRSHYGNRAPSFGRLRRTFDAWSEEIRVSRIVKVEELEQNKIIKKEDKKINKNNYPGIIILLFVPLFILGLIVFNVGYKKRAQKKIINQISFTSIYDFKKLVRNLESQSDEMKGDIKNVIFNRTKCFLDDLISEPLKLNQIQVVHDILVRVNLFYPDSMIPKDQIKILNEIKYELRDEYKKIHNDFLIVRTHFANEQKSKRKGDNHVKKAYFYTNTLFPLLGKIEYAEKEKSNEALEKAQKHLNAYQNKINEIKESLSK